MSDLPQHFRAGVLWIFFVSAMLRWASAADIRPLISHEHFVRVV